MGIERRVFLGVVATGAGAWAFREWRATPEKPAVPEFVSIAEFDADGRRTGVVRVRSIVKTDAEWKRSLAVDQYMVTRRGDTEFAYAGEFWNFYGDGIYRCACCGTALFDSRTKFESGTGWPSFTDAIAPENIRERPDVSFGVRRTAVACSRCGGHLGHVFEDGPPPGGRRFCMNSVAMRFAGRNFT